MRNTRFLMAGAVALGAVVAGNGTAQATCYVSGGSVSCYNEPNSNAKPNEAVAPSLNRTSTTTQTSLVANHLSSAFSSRGGQRVALGETGVSAGEGGNSYGLWMSGAAAVTDNTEIYNDFSGTTKTGTVGFDYRPSNNLVYGVSTFIESTSLDTNYNQGTVDRDAYSLVPYAAYDFGQGTTVDGLVGWSYLRGEIERGNGVARGSFHGYRALTSLNAHHTLPFGPWSVRGDVGYTYAREKQGSYVEGGTNATIDAKTTNLSEGKVGGRVGYAFDAVEPYFMAHYVRDFVRNNVSGIATDPNKPVNDRDEVVAAIGLDFFPTATESVGIEITHSFFRSHEEVTTGMLTGRISF